MYESKVGEFKLVLTLPKNSTILFQDFVVSSKQLQLNLNRGFLPREFSSNKVLQFNYKITPHKIGRDLIVVYFRAKINDVYLIHPFKIQIRVLKSQINLNLPSTNIYIDEGEIFEKVVWIKNTFGRKMNIGDVNFNLDNTSSTFPWALDVSKWDKMAY